MKPWLLLLLLCVPSHARKAHPMTPALKGRLAEIAANEKNELKPVQEREKALRKEREARAALLVKEHGPVKSKEEAKALAHDISVDPEIVRLDSAVARVRQDMKDIRYRYKAERDSETSSP